MKNYNKGLVLLALVAALGFTACGKSSGVTDNDRSIQPSVGSYDPSVSPKFPKCERGISIDELTKVESVCVRFLD